MKMYNEISEKLKNVLAYINEIKFILENDENPTGNSYDNINRLFYFITENIINAIVKINNYEKKEKKEIYCEKGFLFLNNSKIIIAVNTIVNVQEKENLILSSYSTTIKTIDGTITVNEDFQKVMKALRGEWENGI